MLWLHEHLTNVDKMLRVISVILLHVISTRVRAESLNSRLDACGWPSTFINGSQEQTDRLTAMSKLKTFQCRVLISTDLVRCCSYI